MVAIGGVSRFAPWDLGLGPVMLRLQTKIAALASVKPLKSSSSSPSFNKFLSKRVQLTSSASNKGINTHNLSSLFSPKSTSPTPNNQTPLAKSLKNKSKPLPNATNSRKFDDNPVKPCFNSMIQSDSKPPISSLIHTLNALARNKNYPEVVYCYKRFAFSGLTSNFSTLNSLLNSYCNMKLASGCGFSVLGLILKNGYYPSIITLTSLVKGLCFEEKIGEASKLFRKMIQLGCYPNVVTCTTLIGGLCKAGKATAALELHRKMVNGEVGLGRSCNPTLVSYGSLIDGVCKAGLLVKARELFLEMKGRGISPNVIVYTSMLDVLCWSGKWEDARLLYREMMDDGVQPNDMTLRAILNSFCKQGKVNKAEQLLAQSDNPADLVYKILMDGTEGIPIQKQ